MGSERGSTQQAGPALDPHISCCSSLQTLESGTQHGGALQLVVLGHLSQEHSALPHRFTFCT